MQNIRAILFDKDGTLFDFQATWGAWAQALLQEFAAGDQGRLHAMAEAIDFDLVAARFRPESAVIAGTGTEVVNLLSPVLPGVDPRWLEQRIAEAARAAPLVEAVPLRPLLQVLRDRGCKLGVATNDYESVGRDHLSDVIELFDFIAGFDSGFGAKPEPGMLLGFARACDLAPRDILMVGDSHHDLLAGQAAGMPTLGVLTGVATAADLAPVADILRPDIGHIPALLGVS
ncbi:HAD family hydrolase [Pararhodobacter oceanensis]|uniref:HAD family hydrolase n=1 Tax=Pararhodobacter oceanensis TaxID=2172121 RepID=UPI003A917EC4